MSTIRYVCGFKRAGTILSLLTGVMLALPVNAQSLSPLFTYQGRAFQADGTTPLKSIVTFKLQIYNPGGSCLLYEEVQNNVDLNATNGLFNLSIGQSSTTGGKRGANDPGLAMSRVFSNTGDVRSAGTSCPGGYTPVAGDGRLLRVIIDDGGTLITMSPDQKIYSVPYATVADSVQGYSADKLVKITGSVNQADLESVMAKKTEILSLAAEEANLIALANGSATTYLKSSLAGAALSNTGNITMGAQKSLQLGSFTSTEEGSLTLAASDKGKTWFNSTTGKVMYWDGTSAKAIADGVASLNGQSTGTQTLATSTAGTAFEWSSAGGIHTLKIPMASAGGGVGAGLISNAELQALASKAYCDAKLASKNLAAPALAQHGQSVRWNNTSGEWEYFTPSAALASISVSHPLTSTGGASPTLGLSIASGLKVDGANKLAPDFGAGAGNVAEGNDARFNPAPTGAVTKPFVRLADDGNSYVLRTPAEVKTDLGLGTMATAAATDYMAKSDNFSGIANAATARTNLGLKDAAVLDVGAGLTTSGSNLVPDFGTASGKVAQGNDSRFNPSFVVGDATKFVRLNDAGTSYVLRTPAEVRTDLGLGGAAILSVGTGSGTVAAGDDSRFNPSFVVGDAGKFARLNDGGTAYVLRTPAEVKTDLGLGSAAAANTGDILLASNALSEISGGGAVVRGVARANLGITTIGDTIATAANAAAVNTALGLKGAALLDVGAGLTTSGSNLVPDFGVASGTVAQGNDSRFNPSFVVGDAGKFARLNDGGTAYILRTPAEVKTDLGIGDAAALDASDVFLVSNAFSEIVGNTTAKSAARANLGITSTGDSVATAATAAAARSAIGVGTVATLDAGTGNGNVPVLDGSGKLATSVFPDLPAISGANLTNLNATNISSGTLAAGRLPAAATGAAGIVSTSAQSFDGAKTFNNGVNVGTASGVAVLDVKGQIRSSAANGSVKVDNDGGVDWNNGNVQMLVSNAKCDGAQNITFTNMLAGGAYTLAVPSTGGSATGKCKFVASGMTFLYSGSTTTSPDRESGKDAVYTFLVIGTKVYVSYITDFSE